jgi:hypothetical protein
LVFLIRGYEKVFREFDAICRGYHWKSCSTVCGISKKEKESFPKLLTRRVCVSHGATPDGIGGRFKIIAVPQSLAARPVLITAGEFSRYLLQRKRAIDAGRIGAYREPGPDCGSE